MRVFCVFFVFSFFALAGTTSYGQGGPLGGDADSVVIDPLNPNTLYASASGGGVYKSVDGGTNWTVSNSGLLNIDVRLVVIDPTTPSTLYAATTTGVFKTT